MVEARATRYIGWLLRTNRLLGNEQALRSGKEFARVFRGDHDQPLAPSQVTRWESGQLAVNHATLRRYEHLLGLPAEGLVSISDAIIRSEGSSTARYLDSRFIDNGHQRLFGLLERAREPGAMTGVSWSQLTELIAVQPGLVLYPPSLWRVVTDQLLTELSVATYEGWLQRQEAMSRLLEHPEAAVHAVAACIAMANDPDSPVVIEPISLLDVTAHPDSTRYIMRQIDEPSSPRALHGTLLAAMHKVRQGHFSDEHLPRLINRMITYLNDPAIDETLLPMVTEVCRLLGHRHPQTPLLRRTLRQLPEPQPLSASVAEVPSPATLAAAIVALAHTYLEDEISDETAAQLVDKSIHDPDPDQRMIASMVIAATPYRQPLARAMLDGFTKDLILRNGTYPNTTLRTLTNLHVDVHRPLIYRILTSHGHEAALRHAAAWATPHCPGHYPEQEWRRVMAIQVARWRKERTGIEASTVQAITYGIGTDGYNSLLVEIHSDSSMPTPARTTAAWLLSATQVPA